MQLANSIWFSRNAASTFLYKLRACRFCLFMRACEFLWEDPQLNTRADFLQMFRSGQSSLVSAEQVALIQESKVTTDLNKLWNKLTLTQIFTVAE